MSIVRIIARVALYAAGLAGVFMPLWWLTCVALVALVVFFEAWGAVAVAFLMDLAWLPSVSLHRLPVFTIATVIALLIIRPLHRRLFLPRS